MGSGMQTQTKTQKHH